MVSAWWVNQNQTYKAEVQGGFLWSPKTKKNGHRNQFYENMRMVESGDLIFSFCDTKIKAVGVALSGAQTAAKPDSFGSAGDYWMAEGWLVNVEFEELAVSVKPKAFVEELIPHFSTKHSPIQKNGDGNQAVYLASISNGFADVLLSHIGKPAAHFRQSIEDGGERVDDIEQAGVEGRLDIGPTQKQALVLARRGQGLFKANVRLNETRCRFTGVADQRFLIAGHIKPWSKSSDNEKLDGCNGLLFSPHIDRLFDRGFISLENNGNIIISKKLDQDILRRWGIDPSTNVGNFKPEQCAYLAYHRENRLQI